MLTRIYIDNFKGLVNFELKDLGAINLFLGENGAGKSTVFEVLRFIKKFILGESLNYGLIPIHIANRIPSDKFDTVANNQVEKVLGQLEQSNTHPYQQTIKLDIQGNEGLYNYKLIFEQSLTRSRVVSETLTFNKKSLLILEDGKAKIYDDKSTYPFQSTNSILSTIPPEENYKHLTWFREQFQGWIIIQPSPPMIKGFSQQPEPILDNEAKNFVSWYRYLSKNEERKQAITQNLRETLPWFHDFHLEDKGEYVSLRIKPTPEAKYGYSFSELSDGQRMLIVLYTLMTVTRDQNYLLCLDEPENYLALAEIQPWLVQLEEHCETHGLQALLISHHPELINYLGGSSGYWFSHEEGQVVKVKRLGEPDPRGVSLSELIARGWIDE